MGEGKEAPFTLPLTEAQRALVADNLGLVGWYIRQRVRGVGRPGAERDFADLFQEGCLGLARAARTYDPARGIPFAAFAAWRVRAAISRYLSRSAQMLSHTRGRRVRRVSLKHAEQAGCGSPAASCEVALGDKVHERIDAAIVRVARRMLSRSGTRDDWQRLGRVLLAERIAIPEPTARRSLRAIALGTSSSLNRVADRERRLYAEVRRLLRADGELARLRRAARARPEGFAAEWDGQLQAEARSAAVNRLVENLRRRRGAARMRWLAELVALTADGRAADVEKSNPRDSELRKRVAGLPLDRLDDLADRMEDEAALNRRRNWRRCHAGPATDAESAADRSEETARSARASSDQCRERDRDPRGGRRPGKRRGSRDPRESPRSAARSSGRPAEAP